MNAPSSTPTKEAPLLPPEPWYASEVAVRGVIAGGAQIVSLILRALSRYTELSITSDMVDAVTADVLQAVAVLFTILAIIKRKDSPIQPLTLTASSAASKAHTSQLNPLTLQQKQGGFVRPLMLAVLMATSIVALPLTGCSQTARAVRNADTPADYALIFLAGYDSALKTSNDLRASGRLTGSDLERVRALELKAYTFIKPIPALQSAYEATRSASDAAALQKAVDDAILAAAEFVRAVQSAAKGV